MEDTTSTASKLDMSLGDLAARGLSKAPREARVGSPDDKPYAVDEAEVTNRLYVGNLDYSTSWQVSERVHFGSDAVAHCRHRRT
jgi:hypothetical protein